MSGDGTFTERELEVPADFAQMQDIRAFGEGAASAVGFDPDACYAIKMAFGEAAANAIEHGSRPEDTIELRAAVEGDVLALYVRDHGLFVPRADPDGDLPERGRGMAFMDEMMDEVSVRPGQEGTVVRLVKRLPG